MLRFASTTEVVMYVVHALFIYFKTGGSTPKIFSRIVNNGFFIFIVKILVEKSFAVPAVSAVSAVSTVSGRDTDTDSYSSNSFLD